MVCETLAAIPLPQAVEIGYPLRGLDRNINLLAWGKSNEYRYTFLTTARKATDKEHRTAQVDER